VAERNKNVIINHIIVLHLLRGSTLHSKYNDSEILTDEKHEQTFS